MTHVGRPRPLTQLVQFLHALRATVAYGWHTARVLPGLLLAWGLAAIGGILDRD